jgi:cytochrome b subunit of formate dehydrogenase
MANQTDDSVLRHAGPDRLFHWVTAATMFVLLGTSLLPIVGIRFAWYAPHWVAGLLLLAAVLFHVYRAVTALNVKSIRLTAADLAELKGVKPGKYSLAQKGMHKAWMFVVLIAIATGLLLMVKGGVPFMPRNAYLFGRSGWGVMTLLHDLAALAAVFLVIVHVYFGLLPEKRHYLHAMLRGRASRAALAQDHDLDKVARGE